MKTITSAGATALVVMSLLAATTHAKDNTRHTVQQISAYCNTAKYNECHAAAANNYLACAEDDVICRCAQLQVLSEQCAPLCPATEVSNSELIRSYCAAGSQQHFAAASAAVAASVGDVHSNSLMELKQKLKDKLFGKFKGGDDDCPDDKHEEHDENCPHDKNQQEPEQDDDVDECDEKCDDDGHDDDCDNKYDEEEDDDCDDDKYDDDDDDDCDDECDEYDDDHDHDDCGQFYPYANQSDESPSPKVQPSDAGIRTMKGLYASGPDHSDSASVPGRFHRRSSIVQLRAAAESESDSSDSKLHINPRGLSSMLEADEADARIFRDFLPSPLSSDCEEDDDEDCADSLLPSFYADSGYQSLLDERASANIIGWPSIPWPWKDEEGDDCEEDKSTNQAPAEEDDCGEDDNSGGEPHNDWDNKDEDDCEEDKDQQHWGGEDEDDCGEDSDKDQQWEGKDEDDCGEDSDKDQHWDDSKDEDDCGEDSDKDQSWGDETEDDCGDDSDKDQWSGDYDSGKDEDDCGDDSGKSYDDGKHDSGYGGDKQPSSSKPKKSKSKSKVAAPSDEESPSSDNAESGEDSADADADGDANKEGDGDSDAKSDEDGDKNSTSSEGARQGIKNAIKSVGANIKNVTGSGVESSASTFSRQGIVEVVLGAAGVAAVGFALI